MTETTTPEYFKIKKIILLVVIGLDILYTGYQWSAAEPAVNEALRELSQEYPKSELNSAETRQIIITTVYIIYSLDIAYHLLMGYGVVKHHICLVTTLTVFQILSAAFLLISFVFGGADYLGTAFSVVIASIAFLFLRDIRQMRDQERVYKVSGVLS